jgi:hypothetical protein
MDEEKDLSFPATFAKKAFEVDLVLDDQSYLKCSIYLSHDYLGAKHATYTTA